MKTRHLPLESDSCDLGGLHLTSLYSSMTSWPCCPTIFDAIAVRIDVLVHKSPSDRSHNERDNRSAADGKVLTCVAVCSQRPVVCGTENPPYYSASK